VRSIPRWRWTFVFLLVAVTFATGIVLLDSSSHGSAEADIGSSLVGTSVTGLVFAVVGQVLDSRAKRREFLFTLSQANDLTGIDLTGQDLRGLYLSGKNLARANLTRADLSGTNLSGACLRQATLTNARLEQTVLADADLRGALLIDARLTFVVAPNAKFDQAALILATIASSTFEDATFREAVLHGATCRGPSRWVRVAWYLRTFRPTSPGAWLRTRQQLRRLQELGMVATDLNVGRVKRKARRRIIRGDPIGIESVSFRKVNFTGAVLTSADFALADLDGAILDDVHWNERTRWPEGYAAPKSSERPPPQPVPPWRDLDLTDA
jgi:uncharacterized protein YjbI with pentapeptide repeats